MKKLNTNHQVSQRLLESSSRGGAWMRMFFMLVIMMMSSAFAMAQDSYGFKIAGVEVTSENCKDLSIIEGVEGKISYNPETNTLTMQDVIIDNVDNGIFINGSEGLNIEVLGDNSITTENVCITGWASPCKIGGSGTLRLKSAESAGIYAYDSQAVIVGIKLYTEGLYGIGGNNGESGEMLALRNAYVEATGSNGSICDFQNVVLDGCSITQPAGAAFDANVHAVALNGKKVTDKVVIVPSYGIKIAGVDVTSLNCKDLSVIDGVDGKISYDTETNTLTMEDVTINATDIEGIANNNVEDLKIEVVGNNTITSSRACIALYALSTISGSGTLRLKSSNNCGIYLPSSLAVEGIKLYAEGKWGIAGENGKRGEILTLRNAYVEATGSKGSVCDLQNLVLDGCSITQPNGAEFDANVLAVALNGEVVTDKVVIAPDSYGIKIAGVDVTQKNCKDLSVIDGVSGKVYFDPNTRTLTLDNATIEADGSNAILNETCDYLTIELIGTNTINVTNSAGIYLNEETTIWSNSGAKLTITNDRCALLFEGCPLEINNCWLEVEGDWGISANDNVAEEVLTIRNSHVEAKGTTGSICDIANLVLDGCSITQPTGAAFDANVHGVALNGEVVTDKVVIGSDASGISDITTDVPAHAKGIYSVTGVKQIQQWNELPAGIYIVDGVKRVKR